MKNPRITVLLPLLLAIVASIANAAPTKYTIQADTTALKTGGKILLEFGRMIIPDTTVGKGRNIGLPTARVEIAADTVNVITLVSTGAGATFTSGTTTVAGPLTVTLTTNSTGRIADFNKRIASVNADTVWITAPPPSFFAFPSADVLNVTGDGTVFTMTFNTEVFDNGNNFASNTFTAPITGAYVLSYNVEIDGLTSATTDATISIVVSNRSLRTCRQNPYAMGAGGTTFSHSATRIVDMDAGDTATLTIAISNGTLVCDYAGGSTGFYSSFSGTFIR